MVISGLLRSPICRIYTGASFRPVWHTSLSGLGLQAGKTGWIGAKIYFRFLLTLPHSAFISAVQVATAATFSAAWLEGLRMALATLEKPDGTLMAPTLMDARLLPALSALLLLGVPALLAGGLKRTG